MARKLVGLGFNGVFCTSHYIADSPQAADNQTKNRLREKLQTELDKAGIRLKLMPGNEIYIDPKMVDYLGRFPLPVEVVPYGSEQLFKRFEALGYKPTFRERDGERYLTDSKNYIIDLDVYPIKDPIAFGEKIKGMTGVVEQGLFTNMTDIVLVGTPDGVVVKQF